MCNILKIEQLVKKVITLVTTIFRVYGVNVFKMVFQVTMMLLKMEINYEFWKMNFQNKWKIKLYKKHSKGC